ncbi:transmembrane protein, putative [Medicago truncatula]|uniref:Transmembrane protein, putative n=1 Tax=Medicago truncatula TaxID=3880 RepID=G7L5S8_MEDTR|nr:transmembrane protein, putative [Medicago truncatula]
MNTKNRKMAIIVTGTIIAAANAVATVSAQSNSTTPSEDFTGPSLFEDKATPIVYWFMIFLVAALPAFRFLPILPEARKTNMLTILGGANEQLNRVIKNMYCSNRLSSFMHAIVINKRSGLILGSLRVAVLLTNPNFSSFSLGMVLV